MDLKPKTIDQVLAQTSRQREFHQIRLNEIYEVLDQDTTNDLKQFYSKMARSKYFDLQIDMFVAHDNNDNLGNPIVQDIYAMLCRLRIPDLNIDYIQMVPNSGVQHQALKAGIPATQYYYNLGCNAPPCRDVFDYEFRYLNGFYADIRANPEDLSPRIDNLYEIILSFWFHN